MISDILSDTIETIRLYQKELPECYAKYSDKIDAVVVKMEELRIELDMPPTVREMTYKPQPTKFKMKGE